MKHKPFNREHYIILDNWCNFICIIDMWLQESKLPLSKETVRLYFATKYEKSPVNEAELEAIDKVILNHRWEEDVMSKTADEAVYKRVVKGEPKPDNTGLAERTEWYVELDGGDDMEKMWLICNEHAIDYLESGYQYAKKEVK